MAIGSAAILVLLLLLRVCRGGPHALAYRLAHSAAVRSCASRSASCKQGRTGWWDGGISFHGIVFNTGRTCICINGSSTRKQGQAPSRPARRKLLVPCTPQQLTYCCAMAATRGSPAVGQRQTRAQATYVHSQAPKRRTAYAADPLQAVLRCTATPLPQAAAPLLPAAQHTERFGVLGQPTAVPHAPLTWVGVCEQRADGQQHLRQAEHVQMRQRQSAFSATHDMAVAMSACPKHIAPQAGCALINAASTQPPWHAHP